VDTATGKTVLRVNPRFYRPAEVDLLVGNAAKATARLGWKPQTTVEQLCQMMVQADLRRNAKELRADHRVTAVGTRLALA
jgi:GDPmannose 4,6-dehydratase